MYHPIHPSAHPTHPTHPNTTPSGTILTDLTAIVTLSRHSETAFAAIDAHFASVYCTLDYLPDLDPLFLVAFQDVIDGLFTLVQLVGELGVCIHTVRDVEAHITK